jgi:hypothetical protein
MKCGETIENWTKSQIESLTSQFKRSPFSIMFPFSILLIQASALRQVAPGDNKTPAFVGSTQNLPTPSPSDPAGNSKGIELTHTQIVIVCTAVVLSFFIILGEGVLTCWCRRKQRGVVPIELENVMLPSPDDAYGPEQL